MKCTYQICQAFIAGMLSITVLVTSSGCATSKAHFSRMEKMRRQTRIVHVVPASSVPIIYFDPAFGKGKGTGAAKGVGLGALNLLSFVFRAGPGLIIFWPVIVPVSTVLGVVSLAGGVDEGLRRAVPADRVDKAQGLIGEDSSKNIQGVFAQEVLNAGKNIAGYRFQIAREVEKTALQNSSSSDLTVETEISSIGFVGGEGQNPKISLSIVAKVKAKFPSEDDEVYQVQRRYFGRPKPLSIWAENKAALLKQEVAAAITSIADQLAEELFLVYDFYSGERKCFAAAGPENARLLWEAFPNEQDRRVDPEKISLISDVSYDVMIWRVAPWNDVLEEKDLEIAAARIGDMGWAWQDNPHFRPDPNVIYGDNKFTMQRLSASRRLISMTLNENSTNPMGQVSDYRPTVKKIWVAEPDKEFQLAMYTDYECSVRARFKLDNETRMTSWSHYSRFTTPHAPVSAYSTPDQVKGNTFYTKVNIWYEKPDKIYSTNYHQGVLLPMGTRVKITEAGDANPFHRYVRFVDGAGKSYRIIFQMRHAREGLIMWNLFDHYFGTNDPHADGSIFRGLSTAEQENITAGKVVRGMSKEAVLIAYGYPPSYKTPSLVQNAWIYWLDVNQKRIILFQDNRVVNDNFECKKDGSNLKLETLK